MCILRGGKNCQNPEKERPPGCHSLWTLALFLSLNLSVFIKDRCDSCGHRVLLTFPPPSEQKQVQLSLAVMKTEVKSFCFWQSKLWWVYCADRQMWKSACSGLWARKSEGGRNTRVRQSDSERKRKWWKEKEKERKGTKARKGKRRTKSEGVEAVRISWNQHPGISVQRTHWQV